MTWTDTPEKVWALGSRHLIEILYFLRDNGTTISSDLRCTSAGTQYNTSLNILDSLGLVERQSCDLDLRYSFIHMTELGEQVLAKLDEINAMLEGA